MTDENIYKLKKLLKELAEIKGRHTELISLFVPAGFNLNEITNLISNEIALTQNVKSKTVRKNVTGALTKIAQHLKLYRKTPKNGLAVFCGNISENEGVSNIELWVVEPPEPVKVKLYWCDQTFKLEPLEDMLKEKEVYGLFVMDLNDATIAILKGKSLKVMRRMESIVPGKTHKGGQCQKPDSLIQLSNGNIIKIENINKIDKLKSANFADFSISDSKVLDKWNVKKDCTFKIITKNPRTEIESSKYHKFFVWNNKIEEKTAEELKKGDYLLIPEKIDIKGKEQKLLANFNKGRKKINFPNILNEYTAKIMGYFIGDGNFDLNRIVFSEGNKEIALFYKRLIEKVFDTKIGFRFREKKKYYELKLYGIDIVDFFKENFFKSKKSLTALIPEKVLLSDNSVLAAFISGFYDAEGWVSLSSQRLGIGTNNKLLMKQFQLCLLRFGIISSFLDYDNRRNPYSNKHRYALEVSEKQSLKMFKKIIGFSSKEKARKLGKIIEEKSDRSYVRQILVSGKEIRKIIEEAGLNLAYFPKVTNFFRNERQMSKKTFKSSIMNGVKERVDLYEIFNEILKYQIMPAKINKIIKIKEEVPMIDISVRNQNFISNCVFVHNSAARFGRVREGLKHDWLKQVAEAIRKAFSVELKGILAGGPGPIKEDFINSDLLPNDIKKKIISMQSTNYASENGLHELIEKSKDAIAETGVAKERELLSKFFSELEKSGNVAYGMDSVIEALKKGAVELILISEDLEWEEVELECACGHAFKKIVKISEKDKQKCPKCSGALKVIGEMDIIDAIEDLAKQFSTKVEIISRETREGEQLYELGGIGAMLRYKL